jgi:transcription termination/antitermination protein NusA
VDIKSESQLAEEETYGQQDWAEGEWVVDAETGEQVWQPAEGGPALKAEDWEAAASEAPAEDVKGELDAEEAVAEDVAELTETEEEAESAAEAGEPADDESSER